MARGLALHYVPRPSGVHRLDARTKLFAVLALTMALFRPDGPVYAAVTLGLPVAVMASHLPWSLLVRTLRGWLPFLALIFMVQAFSPPDVSGNAFLSAAAAPSWAARLSFLAACFPREALIQAGVGTWRLLLMVLWAVVFTAVTPARDLQNAVLWLLRPIGFLPARRIAVMTALSLRFFALLLDDLEEVRLAQRARLAGRNRNPWRRLRTTIPALFRKALGRSEATALALAARGYREDLPVHIPPWPPKEAAGLCLLAALLAALHLF
ncbi:biotin transport system permease protein [Desulfacinum hydrothermale DSM 13146]|uniref:Biotin transport system permease protein n=1 Tax=Desulfacinum hydrothermale DSM 13146 TaxID=1121390 RepID=A0A1W1WZQ8_9BACT|nr:energy-coupling factor transporter transmembrane component T [Desulfacinum hydrothermale]SMC17199.1 biotin transport system permease protein [Desulfacinum hydrothermale DSM 13146]